MKASLEGVRMPIPICVESVDRRGIEIAELPRLFAETLYPIDKQATPKRVRILGKIAPDRAALTDYDLTLLHAFWPAFDSVMSVKNFNLFATSFAKWEDRPAWRVWAEEIDFDPIDDLRKSAESEYRALMFDSIKTGKLKAHFHTGIPIKPETAELSTDLFFCWVWFNDLQRFAIELGFKVDQK
jgi:hypothetical protein